MSRYSGNGDACPSCLGTYGAFRTGLTWRDVWEFFWTADDAPPSDWKRKNRGRILGKWFEIKQGLWARHLDECVEVRRERKGDDARY